jgi:hypothetical protein
MLCEIMKAYAVGVMFVSAVFLMSWLANNE